jgi:hypothetical protein
LPQKSSRNRSQTKQSLHLKHPIFRKQLEIFYVDRSAVEAGG